MFDDDRDMRSRGLLADRDQAYNNRNSMRGNGFGLGMNNAMGPSGGLGLGINQ